MPDSPQISAQDCLDEARSLIEDFPSIRKDKAMPAARDIETEREWRLNHMTQSDLFDLLDDRTQRGLEKSFVADRLDEGDLEEMFLCVRDYSNRLLDLSAHYGNLWDEFLCRRDILNAHRYEIERNYDSRYGED